LADTVSTSRSGSIRSQYPIIAAALLLATCLGLPTLLCSGVLWFRTYSDTHVSIGTYLNVMNWLNVHASSSKYIEVAGKTYRFHEGGSPGYFIVPDVQWLIFQTSEKPLHGGPWTIHVRDLKSGQTISLAPVPDRSSVVSQLSCGLCKRHWWVHEHNQDRLTLAYYNDFKTGAVVEFLTIDISLRRVIDEKTYNFKPDGTYFVYGLEAGTKPSTIITAEQLIGDHWEAAGLPPPPAKH